VAVVAAPVTLVFGLALASPPLVDALYDGGTLSATVFWLYAAAVATLWFRVWR